MRSYCTIFDKNYLVQGLALFNSLKKYSKEFKLYGLCMDSESYTLLSKMNFEGFPAVSIDELMTPELGAVRNNTNFGQFCWVCQPVFCEFLLNRFSLDMVTYLEADSLFFSDPEVLFIELGINSVSLVPHNFSKETDTSDYAGKFCVQFNVFRNDEIGRAVLCYWKQECFKYNKELASKYPGQLCLDHWEGKFKGVKVLNNIGAGVAPWNINKFTTTEVNQKICVDEKPIVFYHYHAFGRYPDGCFELGHYEIPTQAIKLIYGAYIKLLAEAENLIQLYDAGYKYKRFFPRQASMKDISATNFFKTFVQCLRIYKRKLTKKYNVFSPEYFNSL